MKFTGSQLIAHHDSLMAYAYKRVDSRDTAQDLVQTTYMKAIRSEYLWNAEGNLGAWLMSILKNVINDYYNEKKLLKTPQIDDRSLDDIEEFAAPAHYDEYDDGSTFKNEKLEEAFNNLTPMYKDIIKLSWIEEKTDEQIMEERNITRKSVKQRRFRAKENLEKQLLPKGVKSPIKAAIERNRKNNA